MKKQCKCVRPDIKVINNYECKRCNGKVPNPTSLFRFADECSCQNGITDVDGQFKVFRCKHFVYCPLCGWRCKSVENLKEHLNLIGEDGKRFCVGWFYYGQYGVDQVLNEIKYYNLYKEKDR